MAWWDAWKRRWQWDKKMEIYVQYMGYTREEGPIMLICEFRAL